jgi:hypothetical protein
MDFTEEAIVKDLFRDNIITIYNHKNLKCLQININGFLNKKSEIEHTNNFNIGIISESHKTNNKFINVKNFKCLFHDGPDGSS